MTYMYHGTVSVPHNKLPLFLKTAEALKIKGMSRLSSDLIIIAMAVVCGNGNYGNYYGVVLGTMVTTMVW